MIERRLYLSLQAVRPFALDLLKMFVTFMLALASGWLCLTMGLPAPYLIGSLFGVWLAGSFISPLRPYLGVARWFHILVVLGLGVLIGATFGEGFITKASQWWFTVLMMLITTLAVCLASFFFLTRYRGYNKRLAYLCCVPGGQAEAIILARDMVDKDYVVALFHLVRVFVVFVSTPLLLALVKGQAGVDASNVMMGQLPSFFDLPKTDIVIFCAIAIGGYEAAKLLRVPMAHLLGPMIVSAYCHFSGWIDLPRVNEFVILAQLVIGGGVGARLSNVAFKELMSIFKDAVSNSVLTLGLFLLVALAITHWLDVDFFKMWLAFVPGGLYEVTLLGLVFGFDVAFIAFHHTTRVTVIFFTMPFVAARLK